MSFLQIQLLRSDKLNAVSQGLTVIFVEIGQELVQLYIEKILIAFELFFNFIVSGDDFPLLFLQFFPHIHDNSVLLGSSFVVLFTSGIPLYFFVHVVDEFGFVEGTFVGFDAVGQIFLGSEIFFYHLSCVAFSS